MKKVLFTAILGTLMTLLSCDRVNQAPIEEQLLLIKNLKHYEKDNYKLNSGSSSFIVFGSSTSEGVFDIDRLKSLDEDQIQKRLSSRKFQNKLSLELNGAKNWEEIGRIYKEHEEFILENEYRGLIEQEIAIRKLVFLIDFSASNELRERELEAVIKAVKTLNKYQFPDIVLMTEALILVEEKLDHQELQDIFYNVRDNAKRELESCDACFVKGKKSKFQMAQDEYFRKISGSLSVTNRLM